MLRDATYTDFYQFLLKFITLNCKKSLSIVHFLRQFCLNSILTNFTAFGKKKVG
jgi:hypothetical protein